MLRTLSKVSRLQALKAKHRRARDSSRAADLADLSIADLMVELSGFERPTHLRRFLGLLEAPPESRQRVLLSVPPGHSKTESLIHSVVYHQLRAPATRTLWGAYNDKLARKNAARARRLVSDAGIELDRSTRAKGEWATAQGGEFFAVGVGGGTGGRRGDRLIVDDPFKTRADAESPARRELVDEWFKNDVRTRQAVGGASSIYVVHTRWHTDDLIGNLAKDSNCPRCTGACQGHDDYVAEQCDRHGWVYLNLPAVSDDGEALWPEVWPLEAFREHRADPYTWASLYLGNPVPRGRQVFGDPARYDVRPSEGLRYVIAADVAATAKTKSDYTVITVLALVGRGDDMKAYVVEVVRGQWEIPEVVERLRKVQLAYLGAPVVVEDVGVGKAVPQMLRKLDKSLTVVGLHPRGDKYTRAQPTAKAWNEGRIMVPNAAPWLADWLAEVLLFSGVGDRHDDCVDSLVHAWSRAELGAATTSGAKRPGGCYRPRRGVGSYC